MTRAVHYTRTQVDPLHHNPGSYADPDRRIAHYIYTGNSPISCERPALLSAKSQSWADRNNEIKDAHDLRLVISNYADLGNEERIYEVDEILNQEDFVGKNMRECHQPETIEKISALYEEYRERKKSLSYYTMDIPDGTATIVNVPVYDGDKFTGCVEFVFESSLA